MTHPRSVLLEPSVAAPLAVCDWYGGDEAPMGKTLARQADLPQEYHACVFDVMLDCEDGALVVGEVDLAFSIAANVFKAAISLKLAANSVSPRMAGPFHPRERPAFGHDAEIILGRIGSALSCQMLSKVETADDIDRGLRLIYSVLSAAARPDTLPIHALVESFQALYCLTCIAAQSSVRSLSFGLLDSVASHVGAIPSSVIGVAARGAINDVDLFGHPLVVCAKVEVGSACQALGKVPAHFFLTEFRYFVPVLLRLRGRRWAMPECRAFSPIGCDLFWMHLARFSKRLPRPVTPFAKQRCRVRLRFLSMESCTAGSVVFTAGRLLRQGIKRCDCIATIWHKSAMLSKFRLNAFTGVGFMNVHVGRQVFRKILVTGLLVTVFGWANGQTNLVESTRKPGRAHSKSRTELKTTANQMATGIRAAEAALTPDELSIAQHIEVGQVACELGVSVTIKADAAMPGYFDIHSKKFKFRMTPVVTSTGAIRLEDVHAGTVWLQLTNKSMLMSQKLGSRLADECKNSSQLAVSAAMLKSPPVSLLEPVPVRLKPAADEASGLKPPIATN